jgi:hypothetical protein
MVERLPLGPFVMLNLHRLREVADYSAHPELAPATGVRGRGFPGDPQARAVVGMAAQTTV